eukprot:7087292-Prymnesium_polylepis.1
MHDDGTTQFSQSTSPSTRNILVCHRTGEAPVTQLQGNGLGLSHRWGTQWVQESGRSMPYVLSSAATT